MSLFPRVKLSAMFSTKFEICCCSSKDSSNTWSIWKTRSRLL